MFHVGTLVPMCSTFLFGGRIVVMRRSDPVEFCRLVEQERCTGSFLPSAAIAAIVDANADRQYDLSSLRTLPTPVSSEWPKMTTPTASRQRQFFNGYGQTEVTWRVLADTFGGDGLGPHGRSSPLAQVRIVDADGAEVGPGVVGEIVVRGPTVGFGYWNRPDLNLRRSRDGWWHTTDLGRREVDGSVTFIGTQMRMIKSGAENIYPAEVETCLESHPGVREAAVIGIPAEPWIQSVKAVVVLESGASASSDEIIEYCASQIASYKKPRSVEFVDRIPRLPDGSKDYAALDERFGGGNYPGGNLRIN
jgi:long-chain acyl-CoA synthetase